jgi:hypothetical protein
MVVLASSQHLSVALWRPLVPQQLCTEGLMQTPSAADVAQHFDRSLVSRGMNPVPEMVVVP